MGDAERILIASSDKTTSFLPVLLSFSFNTPSSRNSSSHLSRVISFFLQPVIIRSRITVIAFLCARHAPSNWSSVSTSLVISLSVKKRSFARVLNLVTFEQGLRLEDINSHCWALSSISLNRTSAWFAVVRRLSF